MADHQLKATLVEHKPSTKVCLSLNPWAPPHPLWIPSQVCTPATPPRTLPTAPGTPPLFIATHSALPHPNISNISYPNVPSPNNIPKQHPPLLISSQQGHGHLAVRQHHGHSQRRQCSARQPQPGAHFEAAPRPPGAAPGRRAGAEVLRQARGGRPQNRRGALHEVTRRGTWMSKHDMMWGGRWGKYIYIGLILVWWSRKKWRVVKILSKLEW